MKSDGNQAKTALLSLKVEPPSDNVIDILDSPTPISTTTVVFGTTLPQKDKLSNCPLKQTTPVALSPNTRYQGISSVAAQNTVRMRSPPGSRAAGSAEEAKQTPIAATSSTYPRITSIKSEKSSALTASLPHIPGVTITAVTPIPECHTSSTDSSEPDSRDSNSSNVETKNNLSSTLLTDIQPTNSKQCTRISECSKAATTNSTSLTTTSAPSGSSFSTDIKRSVAIPVATTVSSSQASRSSDLCSIDIQNTSVPSIQGTKMTNLKSNTCTTPSSSTTVKKSTSSMSTPGSSTANSHHAITTSATTAASTTSHFISSPASKVLPSVNGNTQNPTSLTSLSGQTSTNSTSSAETSSTSDSINQKTLSTTSTSVRGATISSHVGSIPIQSGLNSASSSRLEDASSGHQKSDYKYSNIVNVYQLGGAITDSIPCNAVYNSISEMTSPHPGVSRTNNVADISGTRKWFGCIRLIRGSNVDDVVFNCNVEADKDVNMKTWPRNLDLKLQPISHFNQIKNNILFGEAVAVQIKVSPYYKMYQLIKRTPTTVLKCFIASSSTCDDILLSGRYEKSTKLFHGFILNKSTYNKICEVNNIIAATHEMTRRFLER